MIKILFIAVFLFSNFPQMHKNPQTNDNLNKIGEFKKTAKGKGRSGPSTRITTTTNAILASKNQVSIISKVTLTIDLH